LTLRRFESERQLAGMQALFADPEVSRHLLVAFTPEQGLAPNAARFRRNFDETWSRCGFGGVLVHARGSPRPLGFVALKPDTAPGRPPRCFELYFGLARAAWGRGYASEALDAFVSELSARLRPAALRAAVNAAQNAAACRVLEKARFAREDRVALRDYASPALAAGSLALELWRISRPDAAGEVLEQAAFRIGQLAAATGREAGDVAAALDAALAGAGHAQPAAHRAFAAGAREAHYTVYLRARL
jgi:RimJ/RimL family protein N-acetyltransferase